MNWKDKKNSKKKKKRRRLKINKNKIKKMLIRKTIKWILSQVLNKFINYYFFIFLIC